MKRLTIFSILLLTCQLSFTQPLKINERQYLEKPGLNVMVFHDYYPDGHQTGVTIIQHGSRVAANGDIRLESAPGQWSPMPKFAYRKVDRKGGEITATLWFPDSSKDRKGFNPIIYPELKLVYNIRVQASGDGFKVIVDLDKPLPEEWVGKVGFNLELFPGAYFGKSYIMGKQTGIFTRQPDGPMYKGNDGEYLVEPLARGKNLLLAPESEELLMRIHSEYELLLIDGRSKHNNGWFIIRSLIPAGKTRNALEWEVIPNVIPDWQYRPVVQISQKGYHPAQHKKAVIETDKSDKNIYEAVLYKFSEKGKEVIAKNKPVFWGEFLRYNYYQFDFSKVTEPGIYQISYGDYLTNPFNISEVIYQRSVWQPTLEYFLPVQMCHMRVNENYRVWHGLCHDEDALMAQVDTNHFDGYLQGASTLTKFKPLDHIDGLNVGGWHDAGDYDLRIESQADEVRILSMIYEEFNLNHDATTVDQKSKIVEIHQPDGKADVLQQVEHGVLSIVGGYKALGRFYRGIICPTLRQYVLLGDASVNTDNKVYDPTLKAEESSGGRSGLKDDNWVFTEENPGREISTAASLAAAYRVLKNYNPQLASECLKISEEVWKTSSAGNSDKMMAAVELFLATDKDVFKAFILSNLELFTKRFDRMGWLAARVVNRIKDETMRLSLIKAAEEYAAVITNQQADNPYGVPYHPDIWGAGWGIQDFGVKQYFLHKGFPRYVSSEYMLNALNFILGCHPGSNTSSFASGVGVKSLLTAYGTNRADWSHIPGGVASGTAIIRPDLPELKEWPYFWQQAEYVMGGGATNFMFLVLAADKVLNEKN